MEPERWQFEQQLIRFYMRSFAIHNLADGGAVVEGWAQTSGGQNRYKGRLVLSSNFPYEKPELYVTSPNPLRMHGWQGTINSLGTSHAFHTHANGPDGCVQICHTDSWHASLTCVFVLLKLHLWLEAYEAHQRTGEEIAEYLHRGVPA
jgi:ubiquitin-protein ligase